MHRWPSLVGIITGLPSAAPEAVLRHTNFEGAGQKVSTAPGSVASSSPIPLSEVRMRREEKHVAIDDMGQRRTTLDKDIKLWEHTMRQAEAALLSMSRENLAAQPVQQGSEIAPLPKGWKSTIDPKTGRLYYYKKEKSEKGGFKVQWHHPGLPAAALAKQDQVSQRGAPSRGSPGEPIAMAMASGTTPSSSPSSLSSYATGTAAAPSSFATSDGNMVSGAANSSTGHGTLSGKPMSLSAYEQDEFNERSEYFGPFRLDYSDHTIELPEWNIVVESPQRIPGRGNLIVGRANIVDHSDNSFVSGKNHRVVGHANTVAGGKGSEAYGINNVVIGGEENVARGVKVVVEGGYRNQASGRASAVGGGLKNRAEGEFAAASGGLVNLAGGRFSVVTGGQNNSARGRYSAVHGGTFAEDFTDRTGVGW